jgi:hypothetical protein
MRVNIKLKKILKATWDNLIARWVISLLVTAWPLKKLFALFMEFVLPTIQRTLNTKIEIPHKQYAVSEILLSFFLILLLILIIYFFVKLIRKKSTRTYYFIEEGDGLKWKINNYNGYVEFYPFCKKHGVELEEKVGATSYDPYTLYCVEGHSLTKYSEYDIKDIREKIKRIAEAKHYGHYKI